MASEAEAEAQTNGFDHRGCKDGRCAAQWAWPIA